MRIFIEFAPCQGPTTRVRLEYAFRLFCAIQGYSPLLEPEAKSSADLCITYRDDTLVRQRTVRLHAAYEERPLGTPAPAPRAYQQQGESTVLRFVPHGAQPDWLAEIFEWVSCSDEYSAKRDTIGRVAFGDSYIGRYGLNPCLPYAAIAMRFLQRQLSKALPACDTEPVCPVPSVRHFIINTHDVDYLSLSRWGDSYRLLKNAVISLLHSGGSVCACKQAAMSLRVLLGEHSPLDQMTKLATSEESRGLHATYFFLCDRRHRRDGNYNINGTSARACMAWLAYRAEIGLHGSYRSLDQVGKLAEEFAQLRHQGFLLRGVRQHWLRFTLDRLIPEVECAGADYDASIGWPDAIGFRAGACFAFPPYNFSEERPAHFLEIPMAMMDGALDLLESRRTHPDDSAKDLLSTSRKYSWGGISVLWHSTAFGGGQIHRGIGDLFWRLLDNALEEQDTWLSGAEFLQAVCNRYVAVGLLPASRSSISSDVAVGYH